MTESDYDWCVIGLTAKDRQYLYDRVNKRVDIMLEDGLLEEAREYFDHVSTGTSAQAIGYKELKDYFDDNKSLDECIEKLKMETRRYAKRQLTWFRRNKDIRWLETDCFNTQALIDTASEIIKEFLGE